MRLKTTTAQGLLRWMLFHHYGLNLILCTSFTLSVSLGFLNWKWFQRGERAERKTEESRRDEVNPGQWCDWTVMIRSSSVRMSDASCQKHEETDKSPDLTAVFFPHVRIIFPNLLGYCHFLLVWSTMIDIRQAECIWVTGLHSIQSFKFQIQLNQK